MTGKRVKTMTKNWGRFDLNRSGEMTTEEINLAKDLIKIELQEEKSHAQRKMAWTSLVAMVIYALLPLVLNLSEAQLDAIVSMSSAFFIASASVPGLYFSATAYMGRAANNDNG